MWFCGYGVGDITALAAAGQFLILGGAHGCGVRRLINKLEDQVLKVGDEGKRGPGKEGFLYFFFFFFNFVILAQRLGLDLGLH